MDSGVGRDTLVWSPPFDIEMDWLDANGHLNMAYYHVMFDRTVDLAFDALGCGQAYRASHNASVFNVETHIVYRREVMGHDRVRVSFQLLGRDDKRLHAHQTMVRLQDGELVASSESLFIHVGLADRRAAPLPHDVAAAADAMIEEHRAAGTPSHSGRRIAPLREPPRA